jgi:hypothetical protein
LHKNSEYQTFYTGAKQQLDLIPISYDEESSALPTAPPPLAMNISTCFGQKFQEKRSFQLSS